LEPLLDFRPVTAEDRAIYESRLADGHVRGCEFSFANVYLWGRQKMAVMDEQILLFSCFGRYCGYPWPLGAGDKKAALDAILADAHEKGIACCINGMDAAARDQLEAFYPGKFRFEADEGSFDYVYDIDALAELPGKNYHGKRNHIHRFEETFPDHRTEPLSAANVDAVREMAADWYRERLAENPDSDFKLEMAALERAFRDFDAIGMEGLVLLEHDRVLAVTLGSRLTDDTFDVQFEKARADAPGAYPMINREFARYLRKKFPDLRYLDREEDMGIEGLRRAKRSYHPHHMIEKFRAIPANYGNAL